jgi:hypothetical protein
VAHTEEIDVSVIEAGEGAGVVAWVRELGLLTLVSELPLEQQQAWEADLAQEAEAFRCADGLIRIGGRYAPGGCHTCVTG